MFFSNNSNKLTLRGYTPGKISSDLWLIQKLALKSCRERFSARPMSPEAATPTLEACWVINVSLLMLEKQGREGESQSAI